MSRRKLYVHIGLPKTASTFLQRHIFSNLTGVCYLGRFDGLNDLDPFIRVFANYFHFYPRQALRQTIDQVDEVVENTAVKLFPDDHDSPLFISDEGMSFRFFDAFDKQWFGRSAMCSENFFERLSFYSTHGKYDIKLILVLRKQSEWLPSFFAEKYMHLRMSPSTATFTNFIDYALGKGYYLHGINNLNYDYLVNLMGDFDDQSLLLLPYEKLREERSAFINQIGNFAGAGVPEDLLEPGSTHENQSRSEDSKAHTVRVDIRKDPYYLKLRKIKRKLFGDRSIPLSATVTHKLEDWRFPESERNFFVTTDLEERIESYFYEANERFIASHPEFEQYLK